MRNYSFAINRGGVWWRGGAVACGGQWTMTAVDSSSSAVIYQIHTSPIHVLGMLRGARCGIYTRVVPLRALAANEYSPNLGKPPPGTSEFLGLYFRRVHV